MVRIWWVRRNVIGDGIGRYYWVRLYLVMIMILDFILSVRGEVKGRVLSRRVIWCDLFFEMIILFILW